MIPKGPALHILQAETLESFVLIDIWLVLYNFREGLGDLEVSRTLLPTSSEGMATEER